MGGSAQNPRTVGNLRDTLIAGIALAHEAQLATRNVRHFSDTIISLINPFATDPDQGLTKAA